MPLSVQGFNINNYATLKTNGQLLMDLGSITTHLSVLIALIRNGDMTDGLNQIFCWFLVGTIVFQVVVAVGLYVFRLLDINDEVNQEKAKRWNIAFFAAIFIIAILEAFIGVFEKFGLEHHGNKSPGALNGTVVQQT